MALLKESIEELLLGRYTLDALDLKSELVQAVFKYQKKHNFVYREYIHLLGAQSAITPVFLPISIFKTHQVRSGSSTPISAVFKSSSTTGKGRSSHYVSDLSWYEMVAQRTFESHFGPLNEWRILALLPSYHEQKESSLLYMVDHFIQQTKDPFSGYYHGQMDRLLKILRKASSTKRTLLWGVSYALLDLIDILNGDLLDPGVVVIETGGMKGRRKELPKQALHKLLQEGLGVRVVSSEYGMTELLSQAYLKEGLLFTPANTMRVFVSEINDPLTLSPVGKGVLNILDLANVDSCSFIQTEDLGEVFEDGRFTVNGRLDNTQLRGCNLLYSEV